MVGIQSSCNPFKLQQVIDMCKRTLNGFYKLTREDKEEVILEVMLRFEEDGGIYSVTTYGYNYCKNKAMDLVRANTSIKRKAQIRVGDETVFIPDISLNAEDGVDIAIYDSNYLKSEWLMLVEQLAPELSPILQRALDGEKITYRQRQKLKNILRNFKK